MVKAGRPLPFTSVVTVVSKVVSRVLRREKKTSSPSGTEFSRFQGDFQNSEGGGSSENASNGRNPVKPSDCEGQIIQEKRHVKEQQTAAQESATLFPSLHVF